MRARILPLAIGVGVFSSTALAQGKLDHLLCYQVKDELRVKSSVDAIAELQPDFTRKQCRLVQPIEFCVAVTKRGSPQPPAPRPGHPLQDDYICYSVQCPNPRPPPHRTVTDQFGTHRQVYSLPTKICVPARKESQPPSCQPTPGGACFGTCPDSSQQCVTLPGGTPSCRCLTPCTRNPAGACVSTGQCSPQQKCQSTEQGCFCL
jgi:hypothetical protein